MEFWNNIINTAMIGTDKKNISAGELPVELQEAASLIHNNDAIDKEEKFLQITALAFNFRQSGTLPLRKEGVSLPQCVAEEKAYCNPTAMLVLKDILSEESFPLFKFWLQHCEANNQIVQPEMIPALLSIGVQQKSLQTLVAGSCGNRGKWLSQFNSSWNFSQNQTAEELWQTGSPEQRKDILKITRKNDAALAREWLLRTWPQEDANTKTTFLEIFSTNLHETDIPFLESMAGEKSKKVKDEALKLLKKIPESAVVQLYQQVLQQSISLKKERVLLGLTSKTTLHFQLPGNLDEAIFKTGIEKLSNNKTFTDEEFILFLLIGSMPPSFLEKQLSADVSSIINYFQKDDTGKKMMPALVSATAAFKDCTWATALTQHEDDFYPALLPLLSVPQQEQYSNRFFEQYADSIIQHAVQRETEWSVEFTKNIFRHLAKNQYSYNRSFYNQQIHLIPVSIVGELEKCMPAEEHFKTMWSNTSEYIIKLISLKIQTIKAFNA